MTARPHVGENEDRNIMSEARETIAMPAVAKPAAPPRAGGPTKSAAASGVGHVDQRRDQPSLSDRVRSLRLESSGPAPKPRSHWFLWGAALIVLATGGIFGWRAYRLSAAGAAPTAGETASQAAKGEAGDDANKSAGGLGSSATASSSSAAAGDVVLDSKGYIIAAHQIQLSPQVGGEIIWLDPNFKEGAVYKKGDKLAEVDPVIYAAQLDSAQAALNVAQTNLTQVETGSTLQDIETAKAQLQNLTAKLEMSQIDERYDIAAGIAVSKHDKEKATAQVKVDQTAVNVQKATLLKLEESLVEQRAVAKAQVLSAQANVQQADKQLKNCTITAPTTGIILSKKAELGGYVNPLAFGAAGYLCEMADLKDLEVELDIQERDISRVTPGQRCRIVPEAGQHDEAFLKTHSSGYAGVVSRRMPVANRAKGAVTVRVKVEIPDAEPSGEYLLPDMGVLVSFLK
jgi:multidrug resistance efflux pump